MTDVVPDVSVVIPAYHAEAFVARAIQSVLDQPGIDPEIIVVVDGLVDRTADVAKDFPKTQVVINEVNQGAPAARNRGLALARAPYVMFLDADDWVEGPLLQGLVEALDVLQADIAFGPYKTQYQSGEPASLVSLHAEPDRKFSEMSNRELMILFLTGSFINPCSTMWRTRYVREQGGWDERLVKSQDFEIIHRCLILQATVVLAGKGCGVYYQHSYERRLTLNKSKARWRSQLLAWSIIIEKAKAAGYLDEALKEAFIHYMTYHMQEWARYADRESYIEAKKIFKELGGKISEKLGVGRVDRSLSHRLACSILGLRGKEQLSLRIMRVRSTLFNNNSRL